MADKKVLNRQYLLRQLQLLAGHELYGEVATTEVVSVASAERYTGPFDKSTFSHFKYTGNFEGIEVTTTAEATDYTTKCGQPIYIGDKVRAGILVTDDNIADYADTIPALAVGNYVYPTQDCRIAGGSTEMDLIYLNRYFFKDDNVAAGDFILYTPDVVNTTVDPAASYIKDLYKRKLSIEYCTTTQYFDWKTAGTVEKNTVYYVLDAAEPTAWLNDQNILGGGAGLDTSTANDGDFLVYSAAEGKPVWKEILDAMVIGW